VQYENLDYRGGQSRGILTVTLPQRPRGDTCHRFRGQCKSLHALVVSLRIGKERFAGLDHQHEPECFVPRLCLDHRYGLNRNSAANLLGAAMWNRALSSRSRVVGHDAAEGTLELPPVTEEPRMPNITTR
jgi:hypothetical protein